MAISQPAFIPFRESITSMWSSQSTREPYREPYGAPECSQTLEVFVKKALAIRKRQLQALTYVFQNHSWYIVPLYTKQSCVRVVVRLRRQAVNITCNCWYILNEYLESCKFGIISGSQKFIHLFGLSRSIWILFNHKLWPISCVCTCVSWPLNTTIIKNAKKAKIIHELFLDYWPTSSCACDLQKSELF